jgi:hypothetical protein
MRLHLIHIPDREARLRAIHVFLDVPAQRVRLPGNRMLVTSEHIKTLERENIPFEYLSQTKCSTDMPGPFWLDPRLVKCAEEIC